LYTQESFRRTIADVNASEQAYEQLRGEILSWRLVPGTPLSEIELAERLGVSRTPLRAALARLTLEGLVDASRRTAVVSAVSPESIVDLFEVREALESRAARLAARRRDPAVFVALATRFADAERTLASGIDAYYAVVADFDAALDAAVANPALRSALDGLRPHLVRARRSATDNPARLLRAADEHRLICEAIAAGDAELAAAATAVHLHASLATITATLDAASADSTAVQDSATQEGTA
jgi:DNA-binding GntR family transcriptional regulator